ncbi:MAG: hypothetical protein BWY02_02863 [bacterium ADurb.Bin157]|nr:MAG: hypothetical protein BWY02_02863 [bacterium ADurb.Bin157]
MSKHTPGPWVIHPTFAQIDAGPIINGKLTPVCKMLWPTDLRSEEETMVNAELIASLPELVKQNAQMLEALETAISGEAIC